MLERTLSGHTDGAPSTCSGVAFCAWPVSASGSRCGVGARKGVHWPQGRTAQSGVLALELSRQRRLAYSGGNEGIVYVRAPAADEPPPPPPHPSSRLQPSHSRAQQSGESRSAWRALFARSGGGARPERQCDSRPSQVWALQSGECLYALRQHTKGVCAIGSHLASGCLATGSEDGTVRRPLLTVPSPASTVVSLSSSSLDRADPPPPTCRCAYGTRPI